MINKECKGCATIDACTIDNEHEEKCQCTVCLVKAMCERQCNDRIFFYIKHTRRSR